MADSSDIKTGLGNFIQDKFGERVRDNLSDQMPLLELFAAFQSRRDPKSLFKVGIPGSGMLLTGQDVTSAQRYDMMTGRVYRPPIISKRPEESDGKAMGQRDTMPTRSDATNKTTLGYVSRPFFKMYERRDPMFVWKKDIAAVGKRGGSPDAIKEGITDLWALEVASVETVHAEYLNKCLWGLNATTAPSNVDDEVWDMPYSLKEALDYDNSYAGVDRSVAGNEWWMGGYYDDTSYSILGTSLKKIIQHMNYVTVQTYVKGAMHGGKGIQIAVTNPTIFQDWIAESESIGGQVFYNGQLPMFPKIGFKKPVIVYMNTICICDFACPDETVVGLNPDTWTIGHNPAKNFTTAEPYDEGRPAGGDDAFSSNVTTECFWACEVPNANRYYVGIN